MLNNLTKRDTMLICGIVFAAVLALYINFLILPLARDIKDASSQIAQEKSDVEALKVKASMNTKLKRDLANAQSKYEGILKSLPEYPEDPKIAFDVKPLADKDGIVLQNLGISSQNTQNNNQNTVQKTADSAASRTIVSMGANGSFTTTSYGNFMTFITAVESQTRYTAINSFTVGYNAASTDAPVTFNLNYNSYYTSTAKPVNPLEYNFVKSSGYGKTDLFK